MYTEVAAVLRVNSFRDLISKLEVRLTMENNEKRQSKVVFHSNLPSQTAVIAE